MGIAKLYGQSGSGGKINGIIQDYYAYAGENISAGDFVEFANGVAGQTTETSADTAIVETSQYGRRISACKLAENKVFIAHSSGTNSSSFLYGIVCTIDGATITYGTDTKLSNTAYSGTSISAITLENGNVFIAYPNGSYYLLAMVVTISGTTITAGTETQLLSSNYAGSTKSVVLLENGNVFIAHKYGSKSYLRAMVCTISGTTITAGTDTQLVNSTDASMEISATLRSDGSIFVAHQYGNYLYAMICTISGTTITHGSDTQLDNGSATGSTISLQPLPNGNVFIAYSYTSSYYLCGIVATVDDTTITKGTVTIISSSEYVGFSISTAMLPIGDIFIAHTLNSSNFYLYGTIVKVVDTTITYGELTELNLAENAGYTISALMLDNGSIFVAHTSGTMYLYAQIFGIDEANNVPTNNVTITEYETQVRKATTPDIYGVAKTNGTGGDSIGHKDIVSIYQPYPEKRFVMADGNTLVTSNGDVFLLKQA